MTRAFENGVDIVVSKRKRIRWLIPEYPAPVAVIAVQSRHGSEPDKALLVLVNTGDLVMGKALGNIQVCETEGFRLAEQPGR